MSNLLVRYYNLSHRQPVIEFRPKLLLCKFGFHDWKTTDSIIHASLPADIKETDDDGKSWIPFWCERPGCLARCYSHDIW